MSHGQAGSTLHRRRAGFHLRAHRQSSSIPTTTSASRTSATPSCPRTASTPSIGNVPFADLKLDYHGPEALPARLLLRQVDRRPEARRRAGTGHVAFHARQAERRHPRVPRLEGRLRGSHPPAVGCLQTRRNRRGDRHRVSSQACTGVSRPAMSIPTGSGVAPLAIDGAEVPVNRYFLNHPEMVLGNWTRKDTLYGGEGYSVTEQRRPGRATQSKPWHGLPRFAADPSIAGPRTSPAPAFTPPPPERHISEGSFFVGDDKIIYQIARRAGRARRLWRHDAEGRRHADRQTPCRPVGLARPRPPRPAIAERRLARGEPRRGTPRTEPGL